jgi:hypothetical protein
LRAYLHARERQPITPPHTSSTCRRR